MMSLPPFSVKSVSVFNRFSTHELLNAFIGGVIVLVIVVELSNIFHAVLYGTKHLRKLSIDRYIIFERFVTLRHILRLFTGREPAIHYGSLSSCSSKSPRNIQVSRNYRAFFVPAVAAILLYGSEFAAIYAGTTKPSQITADTNFDAILAITKTAPRTPHDDNCDDFFTPSRGLLQQGKLLKCITRSSRTSEFTEALGHRISLKSNLDDNTHQIRVLTAEEKSTTFDIFIQINTIGQGALKLGVFRWDIEQDETFSLFNGIVNGMLKALQLTPNSNVSASHTVDRGVQNFDYEEVIDRSHEEIADALYLQLRRMDLVLNTFDAPLIFSREGTFERRTGLTVGIVSLNRVSQGVLLILAVCLIVLRIVVNYLFTSFDDVAYIAVGEIIGDDCVMGPLAANPRLTAKEVKPCYGTSMCSHRARTDEPQQSPFDPDDVIDFQT